MLHSNGGIVPCFSLGDLQLSFLNLIQITLKMSLKHIIQKVQIGTSVNRLWVMNIKDESGQ